VLRSIPATLAIGERKQFCLASALFAVSTVYNKVFARHTKTIRINNSGIQWSKLGASPWWKR